MSSQPGWSPSGRDPHQPFGQQQPPSVVPEQVAPSGGRRLWWLFGVALAVIALVLYLPSQFNPGRSTSTPTPTKASVPQSTTTQAGTTQANANGIPFESGSAKGYWQIDSSRWDSSGLTVVMTVRVDEGNLDFSFFSFDNTASEAYDPYYPATGALRPGVLRAGQKASGTMQFRVKQGPTTIILANGQGRQITALMVKP